MRRINAEDAEQKAIERAFLYVVRKHSQEKSKRFTTKDTKKHEGKILEGRLIDAQVKELAIFPGLH